MSGSKPVRIGTAEAMPGTKSKGWVEVATRTDGTPISIPIMILNGVEEGPIFLADSMTHGDEQECTLALFKLIEALSPKEMKGAFIAATALNIPAVDARDRGSPIEVYYYDMNRVFPGNSNGCLTERIVYAYYNEVVLKATHVISLHNGGNLLYMHERAVVQESPSSSLELGKSLGVGWEHLAIRKQRLPTSLGGVCAQRGIPHVTTEVGGASARMPEHLEHTVDSMVKGLRNVMMHLGMIPGKPAYPKEWYLVEYSLLHPRKSGLFIFEPECKILNKVKKGTALLKVVNLFGEEVERIEAPHDGVILGIPATPTAIAGNMCITLGEIVKTIR